MRKGLEHATFECGVGVTGSSPKDFSNEMILERWMHGHSLTCDVTLASLGLALGPELQQMDWELGYEEEGGSCLEVHLCCNGREGSERVSRWPSRFSSWENTASLHMTAPLLHSACQGPSEQDPWDDLEPSGRGERLLLEAWPEEASGFALQLMQNWAGCHSWA